MEKNKRNKIIGLSIGILIVLIIVVSSTYAYWQITKTQETPNDIVAACLDLNLEDKSAAIDLDSAWPISDDEANSLTGYTFTVTNNCNEEINYIVGLNRVEESNYLQDSSIKVRLDENSSHVYGDLSDVEYADANNTEYTSRISKQVNIETISANGTNEHTIRVWVSEEAPVTEQSKIFRGQVFITGGQGIEKNEVLANSCFTVGNNGVLLDYNPTCGKDVVVPAEINGIKVKQINALTFRNEKLGVIMGEYGELVETSGSPEYSKVDINFYFNQLPITIEETTYSSKEQLQEFFAPLFCDDVNNCDLAVLGINVLIGIDEYNAYDWSKYGNIKYASFDGELFEIYPMTTIESINLSGATYLETIAEGTFADNVTVSEPIDDNCVYHSSSGGDYYTCKGNLKSVILPTNGNLSIIEANSFSDTKITEILIPSSVRFIDEHAFSNSMLINVIFEDIDESPSQLTDIEWGAFNNCNITGTLVIPGSVQNIGENAFDNNNITKVIIKNTQDNINVYHHAFRGVTDIIYDPNYTE